MAKQTLAEKKPLLHPGMMMKLAMCGENFRLSCIEGIPEGSSPAKVTGSAIHKSVENDLTHKIVKEKLLPDDEIKDVAHDAYNALWAEERIILDEKEREIGLKKVKGQGLDTTLNLALLHHKELAPYLNPSTLGDGVEWRWVLSCENYPFDLAGTTDIKERDEDNEGNTIIDIRDTKSSAKSPTKNAAAESNQLTAYAMASYIIDGILPQTCQLDYLVKTKTLIKHVPLETTRTVKDFEAFMRQFETACKIIENGVFMPAASNRSFAWWCQSCGYREICKYI